MLFDEKGKQKREIEIVFMKWSSFCSSKLHKYSIQGFYVQFLMEIFGYATPTYSMLFSVSGFGVGGVKKIIVPVIF